MRIYYTTVNQFDGSYGVQFFDSQECIDILEDCDSDAYSCGEGGGSFECDNFSLEVLDINWVKDYCDEI